MQPAEKLYDYSIEQCSVEDKEVLRRFRIKRAQWIGWLEKDPDHSIWDQVHQIMWSDAAYRSLNEARRFFSDQTPTGSANGMVGEFLDRGYVATQVIDICKLTDRGDDVVSLRRLVDDIAAHRSLITRENFVAYDGLPYDYAAVERDFFNRLTAEQRRQPHFRATKGPQAAGTSERVHAAFDKLSGVAEKDRTRRDLVHENVFTNITKWFDAPVLNKLRRYRNKYLGHAADVASRKNAPLSDLGFSLDDFAEAQRLIIRIATTVASYVLYDTALGGVVPMAQFDVYKHLNLPIIPADNLSQMHEWWEHHTRERECWLSERVDLITGKITEA